MTTVRRGFVDVPEGQIHYRTAGAGSGVPFVMLHGAPASSLLIAPMAAELGKSRRVYAPDMLGMGDSSPPTVADPDTAYYARAVIAAMDGLGVERFDIHGMLAASRIAVELAVAYPNRVRKAVIERVGFLSQADKEEWLVKFAPKIVPDDFGNQLNFCWQFIRDEYAYFPWYKRTKANSHGTDMPDAAHLHLKTIEMLKGITNLHLYVRQGLLYPSEVRVPMISVPTLGTKEIVDRVKGAVLKTSPTVVDTGIVSRQDILDGVAEINAFLDA